MSKQLSPLSLNEKISIKGFFEQMNKLYPIVTAMKTKNDAIYCSERLMGISFSISNWHQLLLETRKFSKRIEHEQLAYKKRCFMQRLQEITGLSEQYADAAWFTIQRSLKTNAFQEAENYAERFNLRTAS